MRTSEAFQLKFENIPLVNLRLDFRNFKDYVDEVLREEKASQISSSIHWHNNKFEIEEEFNKIMRLSIMGIECYVKWAVRDKLHQTNKFTEKAKDKINNPYSMSRKVYEVYYHCLPSLIDNSLSLKSNGRLWENTVHLYNEVRNPFFHGYQAEDISPVGISTFFEHMQSMYEWIDSWYTLDF
ncbi:MAG: hypothetical protein MN733_32740 [Nitrososphaera sp.]|nr:hypothetical protein [Nitrososphaera sp.]